MWAFLKIVDPSNHPLCQPFKVLDQLWLEKSPFFLFAKKKVARDALQASHTRDWGLGRERVGFVTRNGHNGWLLPGESTVVVLYWLDTNVGCNAGSCGYQCWLCF